MHFCKLQAALVAGPPAAINKEGPAPVPPAVMSDRGDVATVAAAAQPPTRWPNKAKMSARAGSPQCSDTTDTTCTTNYSRPSVAVSSSTTGSSAAALGAQHFDAARRRHCDNGSAPAGGGGNKKLLSALLARSPFGARRRHMRHAVSVDQQAAGSMGGGRLLGNSVRGVKNRLAMSGATLQRQCDQLPGTSSEEEEEVRDQFDVNLPIGQQAASRTAAPGRPEPQQRQPQIGSLTLAAGGTGDPLAMRRARSFNEQQPDGAAAVADGHAGASTSGGALERKAQDGGAPAAAARKISAVEPRAKNRIFNVAIPKKFSFGGLRKKSGNEPGGGANGGECNNGGGGTGKTCRDDVELWAKSFENLVKNKQGLLLFRAFLQREFSEENIDFWIAVQQFKAAAGDDGELARRARCIHDEFVVVQAPKEVNLDADTRSATEAALHSPHSAMFDGALVKIEHLMEKDSFPRFLKSDLYADVLAACKK